MTTATLTVTPASSGRWHCTIIGPTGERLAGALLATREDAVSVGRQALRNLAGQEVAA